MSLYSPLQLLRLNAIGVLKRDINADPGLAQAVSTDGFKLDQEQPYLFDLIKEVADTMVPETETGPIALLGFAAEHPSFATEQLPNWTFTEWEEAGNKAQTAIALIREAAYQWLIHELETWVETQEE